MRVVDSDSPGGRRAVAALRYKTGFDIGAVLSDGDWKVIEIDGHTQIVVSPSGMRALALLSPLPDAGERVDRIINREGR